MKKTNKYIKYIKCFSIMIVTLLLSFTIITQDTYAYQEGSNVLTNDTYDITYTSVYLASTTHPMLEISITFNGDAIGYDTLIINGIYNIGYIYDTSTYHSGIGQGYSDDTVFSDWNIYFYNVDQPILRPTNVVKRLIEPIDVDTTIKLYYYYNPIGDGFNQTVSAIKSRVSIILISGGADYTEGYLKALQDSELYYENKIQQILETLDIQISDAYYMARNEFGIAYGSEWLTAEQWGDIEYNRGLQASQNEAYEQGYIDGGNDSFMASIKDWIVPAIIIVLFLGGAISVILRKREG